MKNALTLSNNLTAFKCLAVVETPAENRAKLDFDEEFFAKSSLCEMNIDG